MKYDFDSYLLYEVSRMTLYTAKVKIILNAPVIPETLLTAADKAFRRFPYYARTVRVNEEGAYELEPCSLPIVVFKEGEPVKLGGTQTNGLLFAVSYQENTIYFNFAHNFCGGYGAMYWIRATLWQYFTDLGYEINPEGFFAPGSPQLEGETAIPDLETLPHDEPIGEYRGGDSFIPMKDFVGYVIKPVEKQVFTPIDIEADYFMKYAREHDGSPNSILSALMYRACSRLFPDAEQISGGIVCNYQKDVGCPNTYHDLVRLLHTRYTPKLRDWPIDKLSTVSRGMMYLQMQPEISWKYYRDLLAYREEIDRQSTARKKQRYASKNSPLRSGPKDTFNISYVGKVNWGGLSEFITAVYAITEGHLMLEVLTAGNRFCISFETLCDTEKYLGEFLNVLREEGVPYTVGETEQSNLPRILL
ncbi:MAG: hypothetical protein J6S50_05265 [Oscillospiraceae bacterium]|nr:hypothetical protein [Oscillospiraceae bacterium]